MDLSNRKYQQYYQYEAEKVLKSFFSENGFSFDVTDEAVREMANTLAMRLKAVSRQTVDRLYITELERSGLYQAYLEGNPSHRDEYESIDDDLLEILKEKGADFLNRVLPRQAVIFRQEIESYLTNVTEVLTRLAATSQKVSDTLFSGKEIHEISGFSGDAGDSHNQGRTTVIISTDAGKCVYKPHDLSIDRFMKQFFERFFPDVSRVPEAVCEEGYGFCEYIENRPVSEEKELGPYFEKLGGLCCVFRMLHSRDLHMENLLCDGQFPILIDLETIVTPDSRYSCRNVVNTYPELEKTLYSSCLFPELNEDCNFSPLFDRSEKNRQAPVIRGERVTLEECREPFFKGFETLWHRIISQKKELSEALEGLSDCTVRYVVRRTDAYARLLFKTRHPEVLRQNDVPGEVEEVLKMWFEQTGHKEDVCIARKETEDLMRGDIPYFYTFGNSTDLYSDGRIIVPQFFTCSCLENTLKSLNSMTEEGLAFELSLFQLALKRCILPEVEDPEAVGDPEDPDADPDAKAAAALGKETTIDLTGVSLNKEECKRKAEEVFLSIMEDCIRTPEGNILFFATDVDEKNAMDIMFEGYAVGNMGIALFATALLRAGCRADIGNKAAMLLRQLLDKQEQQIGKQEGSGKLYPTDCPIGFYSGLAGRLFALSRIRLMTDTGAELSGVSGEQILVLNRIADKLLKRALGIIDQLDLEYCDADPANGLGGMVNVLCLLAEEGRDPVPMDKLQEMTDKVLQKRDYIHGKPAFWKIKGEREYLSGMGHGQCGIGSALRKAGKLLKEEKYLKAANDAYVFEDRIYRNEPAGWPDLRSLTEKETPMHGYCSGGPGIGLDMLGMQGEVAERNLKRALDLSLNGPLYWRDHLCCGNSAVVEFLIEAGKVLNRPQLWEKAGQMLTAMALRAENYGGYITFGNPENNRGRCLPSLYFGSVGVAYEMLRYADPENIPCPYIR